MPRMRSTQPMTSARLFVAALVALVASLVHAQSGRVIDPVGNGPWQAGCSNVEQDFSRLAAGENATDYWEGIPGSRGERYITALLRDPASAVSVKAPIPDLREIYRRHAGETIDYVAIVCYPTDVGNPRANYPLPGGAFVPKMQRGAEAPIWPESFAPMRWPVLLYAHGLGGSPLGDEYLLSLAKFATHGYVTVGVFFADARISRLRVEDLGDAVYLLTRFSEVVEMQAVRAHAMSSILDTVLTHPHYRDNVDPARVGGFGTSLGGESLALLGGAKLTRSLGLSSVKITQDPRLKAAVGYVPFFGAGPLPAFGEDQNGLDGVRLPYLAISGTADTTAPIDRTEQGINRLAGSRYLVALDGVGHTLLAEHVPEVYTWSLTFLDAFVNNSAAARATMASLAEVRGPAVDSSRVDYTEPLPTLAGERVANEFYNRQFDHFFITSEAAEAAMLDQGVVVRGWSRTGLQFKVAALGAAEGVPVCRFFGTPGRGPNSHFFTASASECAKVRANPNWQFEGLAFQALEPVTGACAPERVPVYRIYNNGKGGEANHRYTTSRRSVRDMVKSGWVLEGAVFCANP